MSSLVLSPLVTVASESSQSSQLHADYTTSDEPNHSAAPAAGKVQSTAAAAVVKVAGQTRQAIPGLPTYPCSLVPGQAFRDWGGGRTS